MNKRTKEERQTFYKNMLDYLTINPNANDEELAKEFGYKEPSSIKKVLWKFKNKGWVSYSNKNGLRSVEVLHVPEYPSDVDFKTEWQRQEYANIYTKLLDLFETCTDVKLLNAKAQVADLAMKALSRA